MTTVYVDCIGGRDDATGAKSDPVRTILRAQELVDGGANEVRLRRGQRHHGRLSLGGSGKSLSSYGDLGSDPILDGQGIGPTLTLAATAGAQIERVCMVNGDAQPVILVTTSLNGLSMRDSKVSLGLRSLYGNGISGTDNEILRTDIDGALENGLEIVGSGLSLDIEDSVFRSIGKRSSSNSVGHSLRMSGTLSANVRRSKVLRCKQGAGIQQQTSGTIFYDRCFIFGVDAFVLAGQFSTASAGGLTKLDNCILYSEGETATIGLQADLNGEIQARNCFIGSLSIEPTGGNIFIGATDSKPGVMSLRSSLMLVYFGQQVVHLGTYTGDRNRWFQALPGNRYQLGASNFASWRASTGEDGDSTEGDPGLNNALAHTEAVATPREGSPLVGAGFEDLAVDYYGRERTGPVLGPVIPVAAGRRAIFVSPDADLEDLI